MYFQMFEKSDADCCEGKKATWLPWFPVLRITWLPWFPVLRITCLFSLYKPLDKDDRNPEYKGKENPSMCHKFHGITTYKDSLETFNVKHLQ